MSKTAEEKMLREIFNAGMKCQKMHPDDDSYDDVHFEDAMKEYASTHSSTIASLREENERLKAWKESMMEITSPLFDYGQSGEMGLKLGESIITKTIERLKASKWVSIKESLPELDQSVLLFDDWVTHKGEKIQDIRVGYLSQFSTYKTMDGESNSCEWNGTEFAFNITHWMPLPEKP